MKRHPSSEYNRPDRLHAYNRRQRKKLRLGEFQELVFQVRVRFVTAWDDAGHDLFIDAFIGLIESRGLSVGGMGGRLPIAETDGVIGKGGRGSPSEEDRQAVLTWLRARPEVANADAGPFIDGWYGVWD